VKRTKYKVGSKCTTGQIVATILGQSDDVVVYTTKDNHLRWDYYANKGKLPPKLVPARIRFDTLMAKIAAIPTGAEKKQLYILLGKCLFTALDTRLDSPVASYFKPVEELLKAQKAKQPKFSAPKSRKIFVVHGHDDAAKESAARFLEKMDFEPVILHEQANAGRAVIEKFEAYADVAFAIVLLTPDDMGYLNEPNSVPRPRARQNVIFELGFFIGRMGRERVSALHKNDVETPSDYSGVLLTKIDEYGAWKMTLAKELKEAGLAVDLNKALK
jgi:predicted nucleotide-binding protein